MKGKATIVIITHKINVLGIVDKIAVLTNGNLVYFDIRDRVLQQLSNNQAAIKDKQ